jgi:WD40 repeat protein
MADVLSRVLVSSWDSRATIWSVATGRALVHFVGHTRGISDAALSPDGSRVVTVSLDHTARVWDAHTGQELRVLTFTDDPSPVAFSSDGSEIAIGDTTPIFGVTNLVRVFDTCPACQNPRRAAQARRSSGDHAVDPAREHGGRGLVRSRDHPPHEKWPRGRGFRLGWW